MLEARLRLANGINMCTPPSAQRKNYARRYLSQRGIGVTAVS